MKLLDARDYVTPWHPGVQKVTQDSPLYFVGNRVLAVIHACTEGSASKRLVLHQPTTSAKPAAICEGCGAVYVGTT
jgi:hypothetical protein